MTSSLIRSWRSISATIAILWFAGASAMAGLLNIVPRFLPRYGMAPDWARSTRPLTLVFIGIAALVTVIYQANVDKQAGAYATGVLALMTSAACAVFLTELRRRHRLAAAFFGAISLIFIYTLGVTILERPEGLVIALIFAALILVVSVYSRITRSTELRVSHVTFSDDALEILDVAEDMRDTQSREVKKLPTLRGKTVVNLFFEDSTRTRISFEAAAKRLSADVINFSAKGSSVSKGESLKDTAQTLMAMSADAVVIRHGSSGAPQQLADALVDRGHRGEDVRGADHRVQGPRVLEGAHGRGEKALRGGGGVDVLGGGHGRTSRR